MWFNILGFWMVGFTTGWALTFKAGLGLSGIWLGILSGVTTTGQFPCLTAVSLTQGLIASQTASSVQCPYLVWVC